MSALTPAVGLRCTICGGKSVIAGEVDPRGRRWKCPHHGIADAKDAASFVDSGIGVVGGHFEIRDRGVFRGEEYMLATELAFDEQAPELSDAVRFDDLFRMELEDETSAEVGDDRDVVPSTVRDNAMRARRDLGV